MEQKEKGLTEKLSELKDKVYELEGLLELAALRSEIISELNPLINNKIKEINQLAGLSETSEMSMIQEQNESSDTSDIYDRSEVYDQSVSSDSSVLPDSADMSDSADFSDYDSSDPMVEVLEKAFIEADDDIDDEVNADPTASIADENFTSTDKISIYRPLKFCLNDRFRFVRTLFENDNDRFNDVSESLSKFDTCDEALDWLDREMSWDVEDPEVADFRELVSIYFQQNR